MITLATARKLLDFGERIGAGRRADEQLEGAVAIHNLLLGKKVAYLADEVGMGKTYVALGVLALMRHFQPDLRVLVIAPRENIQLKWMKELRNFVKYNVRFPDLRVKAIDQRPVRPLVSCGSLLELVREATLNPERDFFVRLTSFSLPLSGRTSVDAGAEQRLRTGLLNSLPWLSNETFDLRSKENFKENFGRAVCCALPHFDLVIIDEAHNLKHGKSAKASARNQMLARALGCDPETVDPRQFPGYGPRIGRLLLLSATPVEETYGHLWNQLDLFGLGGPYAALQRASGEEDAAREAARQFLIRRVTSISIGNQDHTKNQYRREWRRGGVRVHDEPIRVSDPRQRLVVALVQKKVSELLNHERFNTSFQVGMLASFESFLETARLKRDDPVDTVFDDAEQTQDPVEREGIDVHAINRLSRSYRERFHREMPHPKMDELVETLSSAWQTGRKSLVFVRRVASVKELKRKLDERYDAWLLQRLRGQLPPRAIPRLESVFEQYRREQDRARPSVPATAGPVVSSGFGVAPGDIDAGGVDTFFAWFFRGTGPRGVVSGANVQQRLAPGGNAAYSTLFEDNHVAAVLDCRPGEVVAALAAAVRREEPSLRQCLRDGSRRFLRQTRKVSRASRFGAVQGAAIELLKDTPGPRQERARILWHERFEGALVHRHTHEAPEIGDALEQATFFTKLREHKVLRGRLWPESQQRDPVLAVREEERRRQLLASAARLGHAFIDLYALVIQRVGSLELRVLDKQGGAGRLGRRGGAALIDDYIALLEGQMNTPLSQRSWAAFDELADLAEHFDLLLDVNEPEMHESALSDTSTIFGRLLRQQQPVGGMSGQINQTLIRQFRMPGYPLVMVTTDLLQEGEDLHTFCSDVHHFGIAWTPSSMEQRIGRIDRVRSQTERRLGALHAGPVGGADMLQVYFPHLEDTVEVLQVDRVLARMNEFLRLMHEGLVMPTSNERSIDTTKAMVRGRPRPPAVLTRLKTAFPVRRGLLAGAAKRLPSPSGEAETLGRWLAGLVSQQLPGLSLTWEPSGERGVLHGTASLGERIQPFTLLLRSVGSRPCVRCLSPVGIVEPDDLQDDIARNAARMPSRIGAIVASEGHSYDLTVEEDVLLTGDRAIDVRRLGNLVSRVVGMADELEMDHLDGQDEPLETFRKDLEEEARRGR